MIKIKGLPNNHELLKGKNRLVLMDTIDFVIQKLCKLYTNQNAEQFYKSYNQTEINEYKQVENILELCEWDDFNRDIIDFYCWGLNPTNIISNRPRNMLALYYFNTAFNQYINETLYTSQFSLISSSGSSNWNLFSLVDELYSKLGCSIDDDYINLKSRFNLWVVKRRNTIDRFNKENLAAATEDEKVRSLINNPNKKIKISGKYAIVNKKDANNKEFYLYTINNNYEVKVCERIKLPYPDDVYKYKINVNSLNDQYFGGFVIDDKEM